MSKTTFCRQLQTLAKHQELDSDSLANAMGLKGDDRRWLLRLWDNGLARPDVRRIKLLRRLARFLGLKNERQFWENAPVKPKQVARRNRSEWDRILDTVLKALHAVIKIKRHEPKEWARLSLLFHTGGASSFSEICRLSYLHGRLEPLVDASVRRIIAENAPSPDVDFINDPDVEELLTGMQFGRRQ